MPITLSSTLAQTFSEVLANLAFMFVTDAAPESPASPDLLEVSISYEGSSRGCLRMRCPRAFALLLSANLLGLDADQNGEQLNPHDAVKELMNVVCGQLITALHGAQSVFHLTIPEVCELEASTAAPLEGSEIVDLCVEDYGIRIAYCAD